MCAAILSCFHELVARSRVVVEEIHGHRSPDQGDDAFGYHGSIEDGASHALVFNAAGHERTLCGMETTNGSTGYCDEKTGEYSIGKSKRLGTTIAQTIPNFG